MKNILAITVFAIIVFIANLFETKTKIPMDIQSTIRQGKITLLINQRNLLLQDVEYRQEKNKKVIKEIIKQKE